MSADQLRRPTVEPGAELGRFVARQLNTEGERLGWTFLGGASPEKVMRLARQLAEGGPVEKAEVRLAKSRNAANELVNLELAYWRQGHLLPLGALDIGGAIGAHELELLVATAVGQTRFIQAAYEAVLARPKMGAEELGSRVAQALRRNWRPASRRRNGGAAKVWLRWVLRRTQLRTKDKLIGA
jgi:hypothetical protein